MPETIESAPVEKDVRETLIEVRAKLKIALHIARDRANRRSRLFGRRG